MDKGLLYFIIISSTYLVVWLTLSAFSNAKRIKESENQPEYVKRHLEESQAEDLFIYAFWPFFLLILPFKCIYHLLTAIFLKINNKNNKKQS